MPKKILIVLPPAMLEQCDYVAQCECRTRSDLVREALRKYLRDFNPQTAINNPPEADWENYRC